VVYYGPGGGGGGKSMTIEFDDLSRPALHRGPGGQILEFTEAETRSEIDIDQA